MAKLVITWPNGPVDKIVADWFKAKGLDENDIRGYVIKRDSSGSCWIEVEMWFDPESITSPPRDVELVDLD